MTHKFIGKTYYGATWSNEVIELKVTSETVYMDDEVISLRFSPVLYNNEPYPPSWGFFESSSIDSNGNVSNPRIFDTKHKAISCMYKDLAEVEQDLYKRAKQATLNKKKFAEKHMGGDYLEANYGHLFVD